jgi:hypothetical protein
MRWKTKANSLQNPTLFLSATSVNKLSNSSLSRSSSIVDTSMFFSYCTLTKSAISVMVTFLLSSLRGSEAITLSLSAGLANLVILNPNYP